MRGRCCRFTRKDAKREGISLSALIRRLVDQHFNAGAARAIDPLEAVAGIGSGTGAPVGREHNRYLYGSAD